MTTLCVSHDAFLDHDTGRWHPECADRLRSVDRTLSEERFQLLARVQAPKADLEQIALVHPDWHVTRLESVMPSDELIAIDGGDTVLSPGSWEAALRAAGAAIFAVDEVMQNRAKNAFCAVRPPGHHAEPERAMGFCLFNNAAIAAVHAQAAYGAERVAVVDIDVHHGNGTQAAFWDKSRLFYASTHQMPLFPGTGRADERGVTGNIVNVPLSSGDGGPRFRAAYESVILPALRKHHPDLIIISAGFDAHRDDPLAGLNLVEEDFAYVTRALIEVAQACCGGRIVSVLEGGYDLPALGRSAGAHVAALLEAY
jgi:acetoin utilization deacetylase AcuC-like enzyme